jgi:hypothetical protein
MGSNAAPHSGHYVRQLVNHASELRSEARAALRQGDHERAAALLEEAEMLAADVHALVDAMEERQNGDFMLLAAEQHAAAAAKRRRPLFGPRSRRFGAALGAGLALGFVLFEFA